MTRLVERKGKHTWLQTSKRNGVRIQHDSSHVVYVHPNRCFEYAMIVFTFFFVGLFWPAILLWWLARVVGRVICRK